MRFRNIFLWLKFTTITPSFYFRNRLFIERGFRTNNMYTFFGSTQKSFTWSQNNSTNLSIYWFRRRGLRLFFFFTLVFIFGFFFIDFSCCSSTIDTQLLRVVRYTCWRAIDCFYFFVAHLFVFFCLLLSWFFHYIFNYNFAGYWANTQRNTNIKKKLRLCDTRPIQESRFLFSDPSLLFAQPSLQGSKPTLIVSDFYSLLATLNISAIPTTLPTTTQPNPFLPNRFVNTTNLFLLQEIVPNFKRLDTTYMNSSDLRTRRSLYPNSTLTSGMDCVRATQLSSTRAARWLFHNQSSYSKDLIHINNLRSGFGDYLINNVPDYKPKRSMLVSVLPGSLEWLYLRSFFLNQLNSARGLPVKTIITSKLHIPTPLTTDIQLTTNTLTHYKPVSWISTASTAIPQPLLFSDFFFFFLSARPAPKVVYSFRRWV